MIKTSCSDMKHLDKKITKPKEWNMQSNDIGISNSWELPHMSIVNLVFYTQDHLV